MAVGGQLGIDRIFADTMPGKKADVSGNCRVNATVAVAGDGIDDSPALGYADVGIAMMEEADVARKTADVVLTEDDLWKLIAAIDISGALRFLRDGFVRTCRRC